jgi:rhodanese-related sulfurtransferase
MTTTASRPTSAAQLREVDAATARRWLDSGEAVLIDVREPDENARERIEGSRLVPLTRFDPAAAVSDKKVIMHCKGGGRSAEACRLALAAGHPVCSLTGGIEAWKAAGLPVKTGGGGSAISVLRQMQLTVGTMVLAGTALGFWVSPWFFIVPAFFGSGLIFAGASGFCGMMVVLSKMPWNRVASGGGAACK